MQCTKHSAPAYYYPQYDAGSDGAPAQGGLVEQARAAVSQAYMLLQSYGYSLSTDEYRAFSSAIIDCEALLYSNPSEAQLQYALQTLMGYVGKYR
jgi:hypothetical protein